MELSSKEIPTKQLPDISPLVYDYFYTFEKVGEYYSGDFRDLSAIERTAEAVKLRNIKREDLAAILKEQNQNWGCGDETLRNINKLIQNNTLAVVTGQQVGLFSGPLYTIYKSLTSIKLAEHLSRKCKDNFVPVFWLASDDHDIAEIDHIKLLNKDNNIEKIHYRSYASGSKIPASKILLTSEIFNNIHHLEYLTHDTEFKQGIISHLREAFRPGLSFAAAFAAWMTRLFKSYGLIFIDATHPDLKELGKKVFSREIAEDSPSTRQAMETAGRLEKGGYNPQIRLRKSISNLFFAEQERLTIQSKEGSFCIKDAQQKHTKDELLALVKKKPHLFSPNVLLRPIYQDSLLPTAAYIGGPGEIAYYAQMKGAYRSFGLPMPIIYPRKTVTILEKKIDTVLKNFKLTIQDVWKDIESTINETVKKQIPESITNALGTAASHLEQDFEFIKKEAIPFEPTLENSVAVTQKNIDQSIRFLEKKILQASKKHNTIVIQQLHKAKNNLYPNHHLQERVFNIVPFLIKYSFDFIDKIYNDMKIENHDHQIIKL